MDDKTDLIPPHLNAEAYRNAINIPTVIPYLDYIYIHTDGTSLIGSSELSGRCWRGAAKVLKSVNESNDVVKDPKPSINLISGTADGCFIQTSNKVLLCEDTGTISIWTQSDNIWVKWEMTIAVTEHDDSVLAVKCLEPGQDYVTVGADGNIKIWDVNELLCQTNYNKAHSAMIYGVAVKPNSKSFATGSVDRHVTLWDKNSKNKIADLVLLDSGVRCLEWLNDNCLLLGEESGALSVLDVRSPNAINTLETFPAPVHKMLLHPESGYLAVCCDNMTVSVFDVSTDLKLKPVYEDSSQHRNYVRGLAWDHTERNVLHSVAWDGMRKSHSVQH